MYKILFVFILLSGHAFSENHNFSKEITLLLEKWAQDFNAKNRDAVCGLFAPDLIAVYPGAEDRNYNEMCLHLTKAMNHSSMSYKYAPPQIEQVIAEGNLAVVRLIWKLTTESEGNTEIVYEKGLDVFKLQRDGSWKIAVSYAYPL